MKYKYIKAGGYIGFYANMGLHEINIDLTKCKHNIVVIKGKNGEGKSTLLNLIHPLPDDNSSFIPNMEAYKELGLIDGDVEYVILIKHALKANGKRDTTKAYISKIDATGHKEELNPNGNVSSYKEIISSIFNLDLNFLQLSKIGSEDRGIVDKTPYERKKFINSIIQDIEVYNNMYKNLSKKSSIFKSMINNITSKLDSIGDVNQLQMTLVSLEDRINKLSGQKDDCISNIASNKSKIELLDPDGSIQSNYNEIYDNIMSINNQLKDVQSIIEKKITRCQINKDELTETHVKINKLLTETDASIRIEESKVNTMLQTREDKSKALQNKTAKLESLKMETNYDNLKSVIKNIKIELEQYSEILSKIGFDNIDNISKDEFILGLNTLKEIKDTISILKMNKPFDIIVKSIEYIKHDNYPSVEDLNNKIDCIKESISTTKLEYQKYSTLAEIAEKLSLRPSGCNIDSCNFIKDALDADKQCPKEQLESINNILKSHDIELSNTIAERDEAEEITYCINYLKTIIRSIQNNASIINKLPIDMNIFSTKEFILDAIENGYKFDEIDTLYEYIQYANIIEDYKSKTTQLQTLENDLKIYQAKNTIIEEIIDDIDDLTNQLNDVEDEINEINKRIVINKQLSLECKSKIMDIEDILQYTAKEKELLNNKSNYIARYNDIKNNMVNIQQYQNNIALLEKNLDVVNREMTPLLNDRDTLKHSISLSIEYTEEMKQYNSKFNTVETLKKYTSPTKKGIQILFIKIYMDKMVTLCNQLLQLLFDGEYVLKRPEVNESEFRLPCMGSRITCDDISSMSNSQKAMISMIISFVLLLQSSTRYNILRLDEIDYALDTVGRLNFVNLVDEIMRMLNVEQNFIITHNDELDLSNCDIILMRPYQGMPDLSACNVIYQGEI